MYFCPDTPALASEMNFNVEQLVSWIETKVGQLGSPTVLPANTVGTTQIANNAVTTAKIAAGSVVRASVQDGAISSEKLSNRIAIYEVDSNCASNGELTMNSSCQYASVQCGTCSGAVPRYKDCFGNCPACPNGIVPQVCIGTNTLRGYLVGP